jgi:hypothetical protein
MMMKLMYSNALNGLLAIQTMPILDGGKVLMTMMVNYSPLGRDAAAGSRKMIPMTVNLALITGCLPDGKTGPTEAIATKVNYRRMMTIVLTPITVGGVHGKITPRTMMIQV